MLNAPNYFQYKEFIKTSEVVAADILASNDLETLANEYDNLFLMPMRAKGGRPNSRPSSATQRIQDDTNNHSSTLRSDAFKEKVRQRDENKCVLTGKPDKISEKRTRGFEVAHIIPQSLLDRKSDTEEKKRDVIKRAIIDGIETDLPVTLSSYNQLLYIGNSHPQPAEIYVCVHELLARIFHMRGDTDYYEYDSDDEFEVSDIYLSDIKIKDVIETQNSAFTVGNI
ncbi:hypothetical protein HDV01_004523 [Terramyces sp. JEL0728]|nr:hypothetical protein HDV01_004523 [Terramyces sp. JEL0728]